MKRRFLEKKPGFTLIETLTAVVILSLTLGILIHGTAALIKSEAKARDAFEASLLIDHLLFEAKSCDNLEALAPSAENSFKKTLLIPGGCSYRVGSEFLGETKTQWKPVAIYRLAKIRLEWKGGKEFLSLGTVVREKKI